MNKETRDRETDEKMQQNETDKIFWVIVLDTHVRPGEAREFAESIGAVDDGVSVRLRIAQHEVGVYKYRGKHS